MHYAVKTELQRVRQKGYRAIVHIFWLTQVWFCTKLSQKNRTVQFNALPDCDDLVEREDKVNQLGA